MMWLGYHIKQNRTYPKTYRAIPNIIPSNIIPPNTGCPEKNAPTIQCHIFKNFEVDVLKFSTVL